MFDAVVAQIGGEHLSRPTPCEGWDVRTVLNHVVGEALWVSRLLAGPTIAEVGSDLAGDLLGEDPAAAWRTADLAARTAAARWTRPGRSPSRSARCRPRSTCGRSRPTTSFTPGTRSGIGVDLLTPRRCRDHGRPWFAGPWNPTIARPARSARVLRWQSDADAQTRLLARFGRRRAPASTDEVLTGFGTAFNSQDLDVIMGWTTPDCVFESTAPPAGQRYEGQTAVRAVWAALFAQSAEATFTEEARWVTAIAPSSSGATTGPATTRARPGCRPLPGP